VSATATSAQWADSARAALSESGRRAGGAREAVIEMLAGQSCCLGAQEIADRLHRQGSSVGRASVYRALELLHRMNLVQRVELGDGEARFEPIAPGGEHHHHAVCDRCGKVTAFEDERLERDLHRLAERLEHSMGAHEVVIHGDCGSCES
jgi:Fur family ferric uptake transcriptional regulator